MKRILLTTITALLLNAGVACASPTIDSLIVDSLVANGRGDYATAVAILRPLATQGNSQAQNFLGNMYKVGHGVAQDYATALKWYRLAAAQGNVTAQSQIGGMYFKGEGVAQDYVRAHMWANLAAMTGNVAIISLRDLFAETMTPKQIAQAQQMARDCQTRNFKGCD